MMLVLAALLLCIGCAHATPVTFDLTLPLYNSQPGTCAAAVGDTCKDLSQLYAWRQKQGATDSTLVLVANVAGLYGKPFSFTDDQPEGTFLYWVAAADATGNRSCMTPKVANTVVLSPAPVSGFLKR